ncbi:C6 finger domain protein, putative [Trichophyton benhamiae CBS 112371]|uniref:C6 finger domain protein, putative n=1 Tax=Arthroderma benhamiae (strain ATCC MYA-4681 / CBS 112371) TaxID=663331 RepID=D4AXM4_ARTBC|nr:C6 finger domain protein, putative [Trichophyton benhamiae CBS 112371]EFE32052.1 C6 finger domain protein, putative [Trichophyton benhamiae CBS 112371]
MDSSSDNASKKRTRKWHQRGFSGCSTCKKRHVKCDETAPACLNCTRRGIECDGAHQNATFKVYMQTPPVPTSSQEMTKARGAATANGSYMQSIDMKENYLAQNKDGSQNRTLGFDEGIYYSYFLETASTFLSIYETPYHSNPFRSMLAQYACTSRILSKAMGAVGALHLANTTAGQDRAVHLHYAMNAYGDIVQSLGQAWSNPRCQFKLADFATCLLLCVFEMLDSQIENWKVHLAGARDIFNSLDSSTTALSRGQTNPLDQPFKDFLVSLMEYLEVVGAISTNEGMTQRVPYREVYGNGQQIPFGSPTINPGHYALSNDIRHAWTELLGIKADINSFHGAQGHGMSARDEESIRRGLEIRLASWEAASWFKGISDIHENDSLPEIIAFVKAHEQATIIYLHRVSASGRQRAHHSPAHVRTAVRRILSLVKRNARGIGRLAMHWSMYMASLEAVDEHDRAFIKEWYGETTSVGFRVRRFIIYRYQL